MSHIYHENRKQKRFSYTDLIYISTNDNTYEREQRAIAVDLSDSGIGIFTFNKLDKGQEITIQSKMPVSNNKAVVRWTKRYTNNFFMSGLIFV